MANTIKEERPVAGFDRIDLRGLGDIILVQGETESLFVEAREDILPRILSEVRDGVLVLEYKSWLDILLPPGKITFSIIAKELRGLTISGAGSLYAKTLKSADLRMGVSGSARMSVDALETAALEINISGSGRFQLGGRTERLSLHISGAGNFDGQSLACRATEVHISGVGKAQVQAAESLAVRISGSGTVQYLGDPQVSRHVSGTARIEKIG